MFSEAMSSSTKLTLNCQPTLAATAWPVSSAKPTTLLTWPAAVLRPVLAEQLRQRRGQGRDRLDRADDDLLERRPRVLDGADRAGRLEHHGRRDAQVGAAAAVDAGQRGVQRQRLAVAHHGDGHRRPGPGVRGSRRRAGSSCSPACRRRRSPCRRTAARPAWPGTACPTRCRCRCPGRSLLAATQGLIVPSWVVFSLATPMPSTRPKISRKASTKCMNEPAQSTMIRCQAGWRRNDLGSSSGSSPRRARSSRRS